jgi:hypothetical protein
MAPDTLAVLLLALCGAYLLVAFWRIVLLVAVTGALAVFLVGVVQVLGAVRSGS